MSDVPGYHGIAVMQSRCNDHDIRAVMTCLSGEIPPLGRDFLCNWENPVCIIADQIIQPQLQFFGKKDIIRPLLINPPLYLTDCDHANKEVV